MYLKKRLRKILFAAAALLALGGAPCLALDTVTIAVDSWPPYIEKDSQTHGLATEVVLAALEKEGIGVRLDFVPWARALAGVRYGEYVASFPWYDTPERREFALFTDPIMLSRNVFFYRKDRNERVAFRELSDLRAYRIAGMLGYFYEDMFAKADLAVDYVKDSNIAFKMLQKGRVDLVPQDEIVGWSQLLAMYPQDIAKYAVTRRAVKEDPGYMLISRKHPDGKALLEAFNRGLGKLHESGEYKAIIDKYQMHNMLEP